jgi:hypothetical protein
MSAPGESWCDPAGASPAQVRSSVRLASVAKTAKAIGATLPTSILLRANEVID